MTASREVRRIAAAGVALSTASVARTLRENAGFVIRQVIEPRPAESMRQAWPEDYAQLMQRPGFLMLDLLRLPEVGILD